MENRNLDKALDIVSKLITGEELKESGANASLYQEYNTNPEVYDIVHASLKKFNLNIYEYNNSLFVSAKDSNKVFGYSNEELRAKMGLKLNKELYLAYFVIYNVITLFYTDTVSSTYAEFVRIEDVITNVEKAAATIVDKSKGLVLDEIEENSFKQIAITWDELPTATIEDQSGLRAARNSKAGFVKIVVNFLVSQDLLVEGQDRYYPTDRFKSLIENYFDEYRGRFFEIMNGEAKDNATD